MVLSGTYEGEGFAALVHFVRDNDVEIVPFSEKHSHEAGSAFRRFGRGRHPARLNVGDCMAYATAKLAGEPLLAAGDDFAKTDLTLA